MICPFEILYLLSNTQQMPNLGSSWYAFTKYLTFNAMKRILVRPTSVLLYTVKINCSNFTRSHYSTSSLYSARNSVEQSTSSLENFDSNSAAQVAGSGIDVVKMKGLCANSAQ